MNQRHVGGIVVNIGFEAIFAVKCIAVVTGLSPYIYIFHNLVNYHYRGFEFCLLVMNC